MTATANTAAWRAESMSGMLLRHAKIMAKRYNRKYTLYNVTSAAHPQDIPGGAIMITDVCDASTAVRALTLAHDGRARRVAIGVLSGAQMPPEYASGHVAAHLSPYAAATGASNIAPLPDRWYTWGVQTRRTEYSSPGVTPSNHVIRYTLENQDLLPAIIRLIWDISAPGDMIWDPFVGSPKYLVAAAIAGRRPVCTTATLSTFLFERIEQQIAALITDISSRDRYLSIATCNAVRAAQGNLADVVAAYSPLLSPIEQRALKNLVKNKKITRAEVTEMLVSDEIYSPVAAVLVQADGTFSFPPPILKSSLSFMSDERSGCASPLRSQTKKKRRSI